MIQCDTGRKKKRKIYNATDDSDGIESCSFRRSIWVIASTPNVRSTVDRSRERERENHIEKMDVERRIEASIFVHFDMKTKAAVSAPSRAAGRSESARVVLQQFHLFVCMVVCVWLCVFGCVCPVEWNATNSSSFGVHAYL